MTFYNSLLNLTSSIQNSETSTIFIALFFFLILFFLSTVLAIITYTKSKTIKELESRINHAKEEINRLNRVYPKLKIGTIIDILKKNKDKKIEDYLNYTIQLADKIHLVNNLKRELEEAISAKEKEILNLTNQLERSEERKLERIEDFEERTEEIDKKIETLTKEKNAIPLLIKKEEEDFTKFSNTAKLISTKAGTDLVALKSALESLESDQTKEQK